MQAANKAQMMGVCKHSVPMESCPKCMPKDKVKKPKGKFKRYHEQMSAGPGE